MAEFLFSFILYFHVFISKKMVITNADFFYDIALFVHINAS